MKEHRTNQLPERLEKHVNFKTRWFNVIEQQPSTNTQLLNDLVKNLPYTQPSTPPTGLYSIICGGVETFGTLSRVLELYRTREDCLIDGIHIKRYINADGVPREVKGYTVKGTSLYKEGELLLKRKTLKGLFNCI
jgi:hypothetical protein